jgi:UPF0755 protein
VIRKILLLLVLLVALGFLALQEVERRWQQALPVPAEGFELTVRSGESLRAVVNKLHDGQLVPYPDLVVLYARWTGIDQQIKQGEYLLAPGLTAQSLLELLKRGKVIQYQVTLPEGITIAQALGILSQQTQLETTLEGTDDARILELINPQPGAEGLFLPETYSYVRGETDWQVLQRSYRGMHLALEQEWAGRAPELPYKTPYEALIMASIIERETGLPAEREQIAGVFVRRLQRGMRLQTDPTIIYGLGSEFDGNLRRSHLRDESNPYNTYRHSGLPPTPIALPGRAAIHAALHPADGDALFFVARGDGGHVFSATLAEHESAVRKYQLRRRKNYHSSPEQP